MMMMPANKMYSHILAFTVQVLVLFLAIDDEVVVAQAVADTIVIENWVLPYTGPKFVNAKVGDTIEFRWPADDVHNVFIHPSQDCEETGSIAVDSKFSSSSNSATYTFTDQDVGPLETTGALMMFACDIGRHCENGQNMKVRVLPADLSVGLSTDTCAETIPTSLGIAATRCNLPEDQICCYGVQIAQATVCTCSGTHINGGRKYSCDYTGSPYDCPNDQNPNVITQPPKPTLRPTVSEEVVVPSPPSLRPVLPPVPSPTVPAVQPGGNGGSFSDVDIDMCAPSLPNSNDVCETGLFAYIQCCYTVNSLNGAPPPPDFVRICTCLSSEKVYNCVNGSSAQCSFILPGGGIGGGGNLIQTTAPVEVVDPAPPAVVGPVCAGAKCDPRDAQSCSCRPGLKCRNRGLLLGYSCSAITRTSRTRLSGNTGYGGAGGRNRGTSF